MSTYLQHNSLSRASVAQLSRIAQATLVLCCGRNIRTAHHPEWLRNVVERLATFPQCFKRALEEYGGHRSVSNHNVDLAGGDWHHCEVACFSELSLIERIVEVVAPSDQWSLCTVLGMVP
ncbi:unnamed protein product [Acanthocheilonema viteae]|uniref:Uncharacterized protein n=1 Tax=Acanthocheilonema viteae TaxID=6277 RepID=A0A498S7J8_ACAVI|nr:unnamed protein product [Acanthocheilonema viteae]